MPTILLILAVTMSLIVLAVILYVIIKSKKG